jgi:hypothetical protein
VCRKCISQRRDRRKIRTHARIMRWLPTQRAPLDGVSSFSASTPNASPGEFDEQLALVLRVHWQERRTHPNLSWPAKRIVGTSGAEEQNEGRTVASQQRHIVHNRKDFLCRVINSQGRTTQRSI